MGWFWRGDARTDTTTDALSWSHPLPCDDAANPPVLDTEGVRRPCRDLGLLMLNAHTAFGSFVIRSSDRLYTPGETVGCVMTMEGQMAETLDVDAMRPEDFAPRGRLDAALAASIMHAIAFEGDPYDHGLAGMISVFLVAYDRAAAAAPDDAGIPYRMTDISQCRSWPITGPRHGVSYLVAPSPAVRTDGWRRAISPISDFDPCRYEWM